MNRANKIIVSQEGCLELDELSVQKKEPRSHNCVVSYNFDAAIRAVVLYDLDSIKKASCILNDFCIDIRLRRSSYVFNLTSYGNYPKASPISFNFSTGTVLIFLQDKLDSFFNRNYYLEEGSENLYELKAYFNSTISYFSRLIQNFEKYSVKPTKDERILIALYNRLTEKERREFIQQLKDSLLSLSK